MASTTSRTTAVTTVAVTAAVLLAVAALVVTGVVRASPDGAPATPTAPVPAAAATSGVAKVTVPEAVHAVAVLREWDAARAAAWAAADPRALRSLYAVGSRAGDRDVAMLRRWMRRGVRVEEMGMQVFSLRLRARGDRRMVLVVTDRLAGAVAVRDSTGERWDLPRDRPSTRRLVLLRRSGTWLLDEVYDSPVASTAPTSGSAKS